MTAVPGGSSFTLTVNGDDFISTSTVNWNGSARTTTFISSRQLTATILASDIASAGTARISVTNQASGGGTSGVVYFPITTGTSTLDFRRTDFAAGNAHKEVFVADFNGDGKLNLAVANSTSNTVSVLLGNGDGTFQPRVGHAANSSPRSVLAGDFNGDGKLDLAVSNSGANNVSILLGDGDGTFQPHVDYATGTGPDVMTLGDFNQDGKADLATSNFKSGNTSVLLGNGDRTLQPPNSYSLTCTSASSSRNVTTAA